MEVCEVDSNVSRRFSTVRAGNGRTFTAFTSSHLQETNGYDTAYLSIELCNFLTFRFTEHDANNIGRLN